MANSNLFNAATTDPYPTLHALVWCLLTGVTIVNQNNLFTRGIHENYNTLIISQIYLMGNSTLFNAATTDPHPTLCMLAGLELLTGVTIVTKNNTSLQQQEYMQCAI